MKWGDYKLIHNRMLNRSAQKMDMGAETLVNSTGEIKSPIPEVPSLGGEEIKPENGNRGNTFFKLGITAVSCSYPYSFYFYSVPGFQQ